MSRETSSSWSRNTACVAGPLEEIVAARRIPVVDIGTIAAIRNGRIRLRRAIESFSPDEVRFVDGRSEPFDAIVLATGYETGLPALFDGELSVLDASGHPFGATAEGGQWGGGAIFELSHDSGSWTYTQLFSFGEGGIGAPLTMDAAGNLYCTTSGGGDFGYGTVFKIDSAGNFTVLHSFTGADGSGPEAGLVLDPAGNLYGDTFGGGDFNLGVVFKLDVSGNETVLHSFAGGADGAHPAATLLLTPSGTFFGSTQTGGSHNAGTLFRLKP
jgi:uncharacterized repeat protein (TIGR03803 family)